jgi:hypothetical protein
MRREDFNAEDTEKERRGRREEKPKRAGLKASATYKSEER